MSGYSRDTVNFRQYTISYVSTCETGLPAESLSLTVPILNLIGSVSSPKPSYAADKVLTVVPDSATLALPIICIRPMWRACVSHSWRNDEHIC